MTLQETGEDKFSIPEGILLEGAGIWEITLVGFVVGRRLSFEVVNCVTKKLWENEGIMDVHSMGIGSVMESSLSSPTVLSLVLPLNESKLANC